MEILTSLSHRFDKWIFSLIMRFTIHLWFEVLSLKGSSKFQNVYTRKEDLWNKKEREIKRIVTIGDTGENKTENYSNPEGLESILLQFIICLGWVGAGGTHPYQDLLVLCADFNL